MWIFLAALTVLFLAAIVGYLAVRLRAPDWPPPGMPRLPSGLWLATFALLLGSVTIHRAHRAIRLGERAASTRWLQATVALAFTFLSVQSWNWWGLVRLHLTAVSNLYAFTFFMLTGLHAAHVIGGVALLAVVLVRAIRGRYGSGYYAGVTYAAMYWHFLDAIWLLLFAVLVVFA
jgi:cytochrome c oxidase subunit 3